MAILVRSDGTRKVIEKIVSIKTITDMLNGVVEPLAIGEWWVFKLRDIRTDLNNDVSKLLNIPIYGHCILAKETELPVYFFYPKEWIKKVENDDYFQNVLNKNDNIPYNIKENDYDIDEYALIDMYNSLFPDDKIIDYEKLDKEISNELKKNPDYLKYSKIQVEILDMMIKLFSDEEEYEKCNNIYNLKKYILNKMKG